jgi:hypothetical protein
MAKRLYVLMLLVACAVAQTVEGNVFAAATGPGVGGVKLEARLMPWSKISGRVVDGRGNGVAKARLELAGSGMVANGRIYLRTSWGGGGGGP